MNLSGQETKLLAVGLTEKTLLKLKAVTEELKIKVTNSTDLKSYQSQIENKGFQLVLLALDEIGLKNLVTLKRRSRTESIPVIMADLRTDHESQLEAIRKGAFQIIQSDHSEWQFKLVILSALKLTNVFHRLCDSIEDFQDSMKNFDKATMTLQTIPQAYEIAKTLSFMCQDPNKVAMGLTEILVNAIEHGNLELSYEEKTMHQANNTWQQELQKRQRLTKYKNKFVTVYAERLDQTVQFTVIDQGRGFDFTKYMTIEPGQIDQNHGRGISIARLISFNQLEYEPPGNKVVMRVNSSCGI